MKKLFLLFNLIFIHLCNGQPSIIFSQPDSGCVGTSFNITAYVSAPGDSVLNYGWDFGDGTPVVNTASNIITHQYNTVGIFTVTLDAQFAVYGNYTTSGVDLIKTGNIPHAQMISPVDTICFQESHYFNDLSSGHITGWDWSFGDGSHSFEQSPLHEFNIDTSGVVDPFDIILTVYDNGCADTDTAINLIAVVGPIPVFETSIDCDNRDSATFTNLSGGANTFTWDFGDSTSTSNDTNATHIFPGAGSYLVTLTAMGSTGCVVDTNKMVIITNHQPTTIFESNGNLYCSISSLTNDYQWYCNGVYIFNFPSFYCTPVQTGNYYVLVIDPFSGCADTSSTYSFTLGIGDILPGSEISISPNPLSTSNLLVTIKEPFSEKIVINIYNSLGSKIISDSPIELQTTQVNLDGFPAGIYFVSIDAENGRRVFRLIKN